jgi:hypothetical protein
MNRKINLVLIAIISAILFFAGCVEKETGKPTVNQTVAPSPSAPTQIIATQTAMTPTPTAMAPTPTSIPNKIINETSKSVFKLYQNDEFGYRYSYPEKWMKIDLALTQGQKSIVTFGPESGMSAAIGVSVIVYSDPGQAKFWENPEFSDMINRSVVQKYGNITVNGRKGYEVIYDPLMATGMAITPTSTSRWVEITVGNNYYVINAFAPYEQYPAYSDEFEKTINSFVIV